MANTVNVIIKADDQASRDIERVNEKAGGLGQTLGSVTKVAAGFLAAETLSVGVSKITAAVGESIAGWKEHLQVTAQTDAVLKSTGEAAGINAKQIEDMANSIKTASLFQDDAIQSGENLLLTFTNIGHDVFPRATQAMVDMSQALGQDLGSSAIQLGKALNDPIQGVTALRRVGVSFTEQQLEQIKTMQEAGDVAGAQAVILAELEKEFGGSAKAASDAAGASATLDDRMDDLNDTLGQKLLPAHEKWKEAQIAAVTFMMDTAAPAIQKFSDAFVEYWGNDIQPVIENFQKAFELLSPVIQPILDELAAMVKITVELISGSLDILMKLLAGDFAGAWEASKKLVGDYADYIETSIGNMRDLVIGALTLLKDGAVAVFGDMSDGLTGKFTGLKMGLLNAVADIKYGLIEAFQQTKDWIGRVWDGITDVIKIPINAAIGFINRLIGAWNSIGFTFPGVDMPGPIPDLPSVSVHTPYLNTIPYLAAGGIVTKPTLAMIGEAGPEAVVPLGRGGMGQAIINLYITQPLGTPMEIARVVREAIVYNERRGGVSPGTSRPVV